MTKSRPDNGNGNNAKNNHDIVPKPDTLNLIELKKKDIKLVRSPLAKQNQPLGL